jgi:hypothetical protein
VTPYGRLALVKPGVEAGNQSLPPLLEAHVAVPLTHARRRPSRRLRTRITPDDRKLEVRIFLAALAAGTPVRAAAKLATLSERRILRWVAFNGFLPAVQEAQRKGQIVKDDPLSRGAYDAGAELTLALQDRDLQRSADRHAGGDRELLHKMWMSGELMAIYEREAIATLRRCGKHDLADYYERAMADAPPPQPVDYVGDGLRSLGLE